jgi:hypothetical protein
MPIIREEWRSWSITSTKAGRIGKRLLRLMYRSVVVAVIGVGLLLATGLHFMKSRLRPPNMAKSSRWKADIICITPNPKKLRRMSGRSCRKFPRMASNGSPVTSDENPVWLFLCKTWFQSFTTFFYGPPIVTI